MTPESVDEDFRLHVVSTPMGVAVPFYVPRAPSNNRLEWRAALQNGAGLFIRTPDALKTATFHSRKIGVLDAELNGEKGFILLQHLKFFTCADTGISSPALARWG